MAGISVRKQTPDLRLQVLLCALLTLAVFGQFLALGANTPLLAAISAAAELALGALAVATAFRAAPTRFWIRLIPVLTLAIAAMGWALWPHWSAFVPAVRRLPGWRDALNPDADCLEVLKLAGITGLGLAAAVIGRSRARALRLITFLVLSGGAYVVLCLWLWRYDPYSVWGVSKGAHTWSFTGSLLNANAAACIFGMISILALGLTQSLSRSLDLHAPRLRALSMFAAALSTVVAALAAVALTGSRTSLVLTAILITALAIIDLARIRDGAKLPRAIGAGALGVILLAVSLGVGLAPIAAKSSIKEEFGTRSHAYADYLSLAKAAPWSGVGPGGFSMLNAQTLPSGVMDDRWSFNAAHCAPLQAVMEAGLPFLILLACALLVVVVQVLRAWLGRDAASAISIAALSSGLLPFGCALVDIALNVPAIAAFSAVALGLAWGSSAGTAPPRPDPALKRG